MYRLVPTPTISTFIKLISNLIKLPIVTTITVKIIVEFELVNEEFTKSRTPTPITTTTITRTKIWNLWNLKLNLEIMIENLININ